MNTFIWLGIVLLAWTRPIDIYFKKSFTHRVNGRIVSHYERDYVKWAAVIIAVILILVGVFG